MKKALVLAITAMVILAGYAGIAKAAASFDATVPLWLSVPEAFGFTLSAYTHDFGVVKGGAGAETTIGIFCGSNHNIPWKLALNADPFKSGANTMPSNPGFKCAAWSNADAEQAKGTFITFPIPVPATQTLFYSSTAAEGGDGFVPIVLGLYITVPNLQQSGLYSTNLVLTMYE